MIKIMIEGDSSPVSLTPREAERLFESLLAKGTRFTILDMEITPREAEELIESLYEGIQIDVQEITH